MKIELSKATYLETDELSNQELAQAHSYYYKLGRKDVALKIHEEMDKRKKPIKKIDDEDK